MSLQILKLMIIRLLMMMATIKSRIADNVVVLESGCWAWQLRKDRGGYGTIKVAGRSLLAHRYSYQIYKGEINEGLVIMHSCDNRSCVNPNHLSAGTQLDNNIDKATKGRDCRKLTIEDVVSIRNSVALGKDLAETFGVSRGMISRIKSGKGRKYV